MFGEVESVVVKLNGWYEEGVEIWILSLDIENPQYQSFIKKSPLIEIRGCYCSVYDDCWVFTRTKSEPVKTKQCGSGPKIDFASPQMTV